jgi:hypothetical protein
VRTFLESLAFSSARTSVNCGTGGRGGLQRLLPVYGQPLKSAQSFVYLGVTFSLSGIDPVAHVTRNATKAIDSIRRIYETFVRPSYWSRVERYCASWRGPSTRHYVPCSRSAATGAVQRYTG